MAEYKGIYSSDSKKSNLLIIEKVEEYLQNIELKISKIDDTKKLDKFEREGGVLVDYSKFIRDRRRELRKIKI